MSSPIVIPEGNLIIQDSDGNVTLVSCSETLGLLNNMITHLQTVNNGARKLAEIEKESVEAVYTKIENLDQTPKIIIR